MFAVFIYIMILVRSFRHGSSCHYHSLWWPTIFISLNPIILITLLCINLNITVTLLVSGDSSCKVLVLSCSLCSLNFVSAWWFSNTYTVVRFLTGYWMVASICTIEVYLIRGWVDLSLVKWTFSHAASLPTTDNDRYFKEWQFLFPILSLLQYFEEAWSTEVSCLPLVFVLLSIYTPPGHSVMTPW